MNMLKGLGALSNAYLKETLRSKTALFWNLLFPQFFLFGFALIFGGSDPARVTYLMPGLLTITVISATFFGISYSMVNQRETGVYRRFRATPVTAITVVLAHASTALFNLVTGLGLELLLAKLVFKITVAGSIVQLVLAILIAAFAFIPLGLIIGSVARDIKTAPAITNLLFFPMMFLSGAAVPFFMLPAWLRQVGELLPATYVVELLQGVMVRGDSFAHLLTPIGILLLSGILGFAVNGLLFRWESTEPIRKDRLAIAIGVLAAVYVAAFLIGPKLKMAQPPPGSAGRGDIGKSVILVTNVPGNLKMPGML